MGSSVATGRKTKRAIRPKALRAARNWMRGLGKIFQRVALFQIDGTLARVVAVKGIPPHPVGESVSLIDQTPLRWAVEAASPIVGAGRSPGAIIIPAALGVTTPRAFAVLPLAVNRRLVALAYVDNGDKPLPVSNVGELFEFCAQVLEGTTKPAKPQIRENPKSTARRTGTRYRPPGLQRERHDSSESDDGGPQRFRIDDLDDVLDLDIIHEANREEIDLAITDALRELAADPESPPGVAGSILSAVAPPMPPPCGVITRPGSSTSRFLSSPELAGAALQSDGRPPSPVAAPPDPAVFAEFGSPETNGHLSIAAIEALAFGIAAELDDAEDGFDEPHHTLHRPMVPGADLFKPEIPPPALIVPAPGAPVPETPSGVDLIPFAPEIELMPLFPEPVGTEILSRLAYDPAATGTLVVTPEGVRPASEVVTQRRPIHWRRLAVLASLGFLAALIWAIVAVSPAGDITGNRMVEIFPKSTLSEIAIQLHEEGLIRSPKALQLLARLSGIDRELRAGTYSLPTGVWAWTVMTELHAGQVQTRTVTVPEGYTLREIAALLERAGLASSARLIKEARNPEILTQFGIDAPSVEGFLFPETYTLAEGLSEREILSVMIGQFFQRIRSLPGAAGLSREAIFDRVTLASLVEREAQDRSEQRRIAGVFQNRIERNMRLESCATVQYVIQRPKARLRLTDLRTESPYNTYLHEGLPPGPIANPGFSALAAALEPEAHDFLFFVARENGSKRHVFTKTFAAHEAARKRARHSP